MMKEYKRFRREEVARRFGHSLESVVEIFLEESPQLVQNFRRSILEGEGPKELERQAHSLKGSLDMIASSELANSARSIEEALGEGVSLGALSGRCEELLTQVEDLEMELRDYLSELRHQPDF